MCGIVGVWAREQRVDTAVFLCQMDSLTHRGPDGSGMEVLAGGEIAFGHRRLSIIDLSETGRQPMSNETGSVWVTFNGEIYNYRSLRKELIDRGHKFASESDTEVIVHAYEEWGEKCLNRFRGIFAFAIWDDSARELFLARDHLGVKPLYFSNKEGKFQFASEARAILLGDPNLRKVDREALRDFFCFSYVPGASCIYDGVSKLRPGHFVKVKEGRTQIVRYWQPQYRPEILTMEEAVEAVSAKLAEVTDLQRESDVPIGSLLSGGVDSSLLTGLLAKKDQSGLPGATSFTIGFDKEGRDERKYARIAADHFGTVHHEREMNRERFPVQLASAIEAFDEPFDPNGPMPALFLAQLVTDENHKVVWGGDGGDELFAGYLRYDEFNQFMNEGRRSFLGRSRKQDLARAADQFFSYEGVADRSALAEIFGKKVGGDFLKGYRDQYRACYDPDLPPVVAGQMIDLHLFLPDHVLCKVDRAMMCHGVEARVPLLDPEMVELAFSIDAQVNYQHSERKAVLKKVAENYLPKQLLDGRKMGFSSPIGFWCKRDFRIWAENLIEDGALVASGLIAPGAAPRLRSVGAEGFRLFWLLLTAELWARRWIEGEAVAIPG